MTNTRTGLFNLTLYVCTSIKASALMEQHSLTHTSYPLGTNGTRGGDFWRVDLVLRIQSGNWTSERPTNSWHLLAFKMYNSFPLFHNTFIQQLTRCRFCSTFFCLREIDILHMLSIFSRKILNSRTTDYSRLEAHLFRWSCLLLHKITHLFLDQRNMKTVTSSSG